jgi:hypothetical protein
MNCGFEPSVTGGALIVTTIFSQPKAVAFAAFGPGEGKGSVADYYCEVDEAPAIDALTDGVATTILLPCRHT